MCKSQICFSALLISYSPFVYNGCPHFVQFKSSWLGHIFLLIENLPRPLPEHPPSHHPPLVLLPCPCGSSQLLAYSISSNSSCCWSMSLKLSSWSKIPSSWMKLGRHVLLFRRALKVDWLKVNDMKKKGVFYLCNDNHVGLDFPLCVVICCRYSRSRSLFSGSPLVAPIWVLVDVPECALELPQELAEFVAGEMNL